MTDLATRIEALFNKRWPIDQLSEHEWLAKHDRLEVMLSCGAFESALMQFCVPDGHKWAVTSRNSACCDLHGEVTGPLTWLFDKTPAEALCAALEAAWAEVEKG